MLLAKPMQYRFLILIFVATLSIFPRAAYSADPVAAFNQAMEKDDLNRVRKIFEKAKSHPKVLAALESRLKDLFLSSFKTITGRELQDSRELAKELIPNCKTLNLSEPEMTAIFEYSQSAYGLVNASFAADAKSDDKALTFPFVVELDRALSKLPPYSGLTTHGQDEDLYDTVEGHTIVQNYFMSTSMYDPQEKPIFDGSTMLKIFSKTGHDISKCSALPSEREVLFRPGTQFILRQNDDPIFKYYLEEIQ